MVCKAMTQDDVTQATNVGRCPTTGTQGTLRVKSQGVEEDQQGRVGRNYSEVGGELEQYILEARGRKYFKEKERD